METQKRKQKKLQSERKRSITIQLDMDAIHELDKRARKNFMTLREQIVDIIRRSMVAYGKDKRRGYAEPDVGKFVKIFSRKKRGRKPKR
jgi:hypothetical protein